MASALRTFYLWRRSSCMNHALGCFGEGVVFSNGVVVTRIYNPKDMFYYDNLGDMKEIYATIGDDVCIMFN